MASTRTYLDHNATSPLRPEAREAVLAALDLHGNPSSVHAEGRQARAVIEQAREQVAALVGARPGEVVLLSGGTEANNAILWAWWDALVPSSIEHDSVLEPAKACGARLRIVPARADGLVDVAAFEALLAREGKALGRALVSVQLANNETGAVQPVAQIAELARACGLAMHTDAVQAAGKIAVDFEALGVDFMTLSAHKLGGPKGVGALILREGSRLEPFLRGGGQEMRMRAGTENVAGIVGFGAAAEAAARDLPKSTPLAQLRDRLEREVLALTPEAVSIAGGVERLPNTSCIALPGANAETLVIALDLAGVAVSAGAACSSGKVKQSHVLTAMGMPADITGSAVRVSLGWDTRDADIEAFLRAWASVTGRLRKTAA
jgi:cysteine desulfurase